MDHSTYRLILNFNSRDIFFHRINIIKIYNLYSYTPSIPYTTHNIFQKLNSLSLIRNSLIELSIKKNLFICKLRKNY